MKTIIILLFYFFIYAGCANQFSQDTTGLSKECFLLKEAQDCLFETKKPGCLRDSLASMSLIGTRHEQLLDRVKPGDLTAFHKGDLSKSPGFADFISKKDMQNLSLSFYEKTRDLIDKNSQADTLINFRQHYNCPAPTV